MALTNIFASQAGPIPLLLLDQNFNDFANTSDATKGAALLGYTASLAIAYAAGTVGAKLRQIVNIKDAPYNALAGNSNSANLASLQAAIAAYATAGAVIIVPWDISYGYKVTDPTTFPNFTGVTKPMLVVDYGPGNSYAGFPTGYDGMQVRSFSFTPQTTAPVTFTAPILAAATSATLSVAWAPISGPWFVTFSDGEVRNVTFTNGATTATWTTPLTSNVTANANYQNSGQHDGNAVVQRGSWVPGFTAFNDGNYGAPSSANRTALDNRRAFFAFGNDGVATWAMLQQGAIGAAATNEAMSGFSIQKYAAPGDTLGAYCPFYVDRATGNMVYGLGTQSPAAHHHFGRVASSPVLAIMMLQSDTTTSDLVLRDSVGVADDVAVKNVSGDLILRLQATGDALQLKKTTRRIQVVKALALSKVNLAYSASMTPDSDTGNIFQIFANNGTAFTINAPVGTLTDGQLITVRISNTSGGALGAVTWNVAFKMSAWTQPANGFGRSIQFYYDGSTPAWIQVGGASIDVPN